MANTLPQVFWAKHGKVRPYHWKILNWGIPDIHWLVIWKVHGHLELVSPCITPRQSTFDTVDTFLRLGSLVNRLWTEIPSQSTRRPHVSKGTSLCQIWQFWSSSLWPPCHLSVFGISPHWLQVGQTRLGGQHGAPALFHGDVVSHAGPSGQETRQTRCRQGTTHQSNLPHMQCAMKASWPSRFWDGHSLLLGRCRVAFVHRAWWRWNGMHGPTPGRWAWASNWSTEDELLSCHRVSALSDWVSHGIG